MRTLLLLAIAFALAGCASTPAPVAEPTVAPTPEAVVEEPVDFTLYTPLAGCVSIVCGGGNNGPGAIALGGVNMTAFELIVSLDDPASQAGALVPVRITAQCIGDHATCPAGALAVSDGPWPATLKAAGFRIQAPDLLEFRVDYQGPAMGPLMGGNEEFHLKGTLQHSLGEIAYQ